MSVCSLSGYYADRAADYEARYQLPELQADLARLRALLPALAAGRRVLEVGAGTGYWTQLLAPAAAALTATDGDAELVAIAAQRDYGTAAVTFVRASAAELAGVPGEFDVVVCAFCWAGLDAAGVTRLLAAIATRAGPGAVVVACDRHWDGEAGLVAGLAGIATSADRTELDACWVVAAVLR